MWSIKELFDPEGLLNPDVVLSRNPGIHLENLKPLPAADPIVDRCIECGFCEPICPSRDLTLTPRQRIVVRREMARLERTGDDPARLADLTEAYRYDGLETCAATGLCALPCPVSINTGDLVRRMRGERNAHLAGRAAFAGRHFAGVTGLMRGGLRVSHALRRVVGAPAVGGLGRAARRLSGRRLPHWLPATPRAASTGALRRPAATADDRAPAVVYLPSCATRVFGASPEDTDTRSTPELTLTLLQRAGYRVILPEAVDGLCCGMPFESKGLAAEADRKAGELRSALLAASEHGRHPILCDTSPCTLRMKRTLSPDLAVYEPVGFLHEHALSRLTVTPKTEPVTVHVTCSSQHMGLGEVFLSVARTCAHQVVVPADIHCCGFAGDKGFQTPELNAAALSGLAEQVAGCAVGYSNSRTCEIGLTEHSGVPYRSILALVEETTRAGPQRHRPATA